MRLSPSRSSGRSRLPSRRPEVAAVRVRQCGGSHALRGAHQRAFGETRRRGLGEHGSRDDAGGENFAVPELPGV